MGIIIYTGRISRHLERKYARRSGEGLLEYETIGKFLADIRKEFGREDEKSVKVVELKRLEQGEKTIEKFIQEF